METEIGRDVGGVGYASAPQAVPRASGMIVGPMLKWLKSLPDGKPTENAPTLLADAATRVCRFEFDAAELLCRRVLAAYAQTDGDGLVTARAMELLRAIEHNRTSYLYLQVYNPQAQQKTGLVIAPDSVSSGRLRGFAEASWSWLQHRCTVSAVTGQFRVRFEKGRMLVAGTVSEHCQVVYAFANELLFASARTVPRKPAKQGRTRRFSFLIGRGLVLFPRDAAIRFTLSTGRDIILHEGVASSYACSWPKGAGGIEDTIRSGAILTAHGSIMPAPLRATVDCWLGTYEALAGVMAARWKKPVFLYYGTLLGAVRDQAVIPFDDDFDVAYFSAKLTVAEVREEMIEIIASIAASNPTMKIRLINFFFKVSLNGGSIDVFPTWHDGEFLWSPWATRLRCERNLLIKLKEIEFLGHRVHVPARAETFLELKYGPNWRQPDPAYRKQPQPGIEFPFHALKFGESDRSRIVERARQLAGSAKVATVEFWRK